MANQEFTNINGIYVCDQTARDNVPTKISQLVNDANYTNETYVINKISEAQLNGSTVDLSEYITKENGNANYITFSDGQTFQEKFDNGILTGPKGDKGDTGEQGIQGEVGPQGPAGADGLTTAISVNGATYQHVNGVISLPDSYFLSSVINDRNNYFHGKTYGETLSYLFNLINNANNRVYYSNLVYSLPAPRTLTADNNNYIDTGIKLFDPETKFFTILIRFSNSELNDIVSSNAHTILHCMDENTYNGISLAVNSGHITFDYTNSSTNGTSDLLTNIGCNDEVGHTIILCKDNNKIRIYLDSVDNYYDIIPSYPLTEPLYKNLLVGCYQTADGTKGRYWNGTVFDLKIWEECFSEYNVSTLFG